MSLIQTAVLASLIAAFGLAISGRAPAAEPPMLPGTPAAAIHVVASEAASQFVPLGVGKSVVIDFPRDIKDVLVGDPKIANAVIRSTRRAYIIGAAVGQTSVFFFDIDGHQIGGFDIAVTRDLNGLRAALKQALPGLDIHVEGLGDGIVLTGNVSAPIEAQQAFDIASRLVDDGHKVVNGIAVHGRAPRVSVQAFCETVETAAAVQTAGEDRRLAKAHVKLQMGGLTAALGAYSNAPTPNVIIIESESRGTDLLPGLDSLAEVCDAGTRVVVIGRYR
jgi:Flp pilus assembly secretin CpaC